MIVRGNVIARHLGFAWQFRADPCRKQQRGRQQVDREFTERIHQTKMFIAGVSSAAL
jgi:hypothetical protein